jgi:hypothetical protein
MRNHLIINIDDTQILIRINIVLINAKAWSRALSKCYSALLPLIVQTPVAM